MKTTWKDIAPVPTSTEFLDVDCFVTNAASPSHFDPKVSPVLPHLDNAKKKRLLTSRSGFKISRIRAFYTRKVKFTAETFSEKLSLILEGFPRLNDLHPFHKDLMNQAMFYGPEWYQMDKPNPGQSTWVPSQRICTSEDQFGLAGYAIYAQSAYLNMHNLCINGSDALCFHNQVPVVSLRRPDIIWAFGNATATNLNSVGHFDYQYLRFQAIDTPEMQSITAIAHLRAAILYFMDLSEQCGYSVKSQMQLFRSLKPLFANKLLFIVINKIDVLKRDQLDAATAAELDELISSAGVEILELSCNTTEGVQEAKNLVSDRLLAHRVSEKVNAGTNSSGAIGSRLADVMARIHVAQPTEVRESFIPEAALAKKKYSMDDPNRPMLARDMEEANGGAGVFNVDLKADYLLENPEWNHDRIPEIFDGKNIYDYVDPDIEAKLQALEEEEEKLEAEGYYDSDEEIDDVETAEVRRKADQIRTKQALIRNEAKMRRIKNRAALPRSAIKKPLSQLEDSLDQLGVDTEELQLRGRSQTTSRGRSMTRSRLGTEDPNAMDVDQTPRERLRSKSRARSQPATNRREDGIVDETTRTKVEKQAKLAQRKMNRNARQGEADRHTTASLAKHLFSGKRSIGKASHR
ncbi:hypothetical protein CHU98_g190 [Xylaria longipes]|nr:hypothetical protein CHU98_g190 [Xylaria longipes]